MVFHTNQQGKLFKRSMLAMCVMAFSAPTFAQNATKATDKKDATKDVEEVVVTGMKEALSSAQEIKKNADTVVDSITAKDLGSFPDKSVGEALQRVAGITVNRFAASSDTAHFSAEPSGVIVRGLNQVRTEFNGRDSFSANSARGLSWGDISPELMAGVDTYKNQTAELIEGGIAGSVNMRTRVPFDQSGNMYALTVNANYGDLSKKYTPEVSGLASTRWETGVGEFGVLGNLAYSSVETRSEGVQLNRMNRFNGVWGTGIQYLPDGVYFRDNTYDRDRKGGSLAFQWKDNDEVYIATLQFNRSQYENNWQEYVVAPNVGNASFGQSVFYTINPGNDKVPLPAAGSDPFTFNKAGLFQTGTLTSKYGWWGGTTDGSKAFATMSNGQPLTNTCESWAGCTGPALTNQGIPVTSTTRYNQNKNVTQDVGFNLKWNPSDRVHGSFDAQYVDANVQNYDISTDFNSFTSAKVDLTGTLPKVTLMAPANMNLSTGMYTNPNNFYINDIMDHIEDSFGHEAAFRTDFKIDVDSGWVDNVKVGARYADREQTVQWSGYNWQNVANSWTGCADRTSIRNPGITDPTNADYYYCRENQSSYFNLDQTAPSPLLANADVAGHFKGYPTNFYTTRPWASNYGGLSVLGGSNTFVVANMDLLKNRKAWASEMSATALGLTNGRGWDPVCSNIGDRANEVPGTCFTPAESVDVSEKSKAFYVQVDFGGEHLHLLDKPISGNLGVRYVETDLESIGGESYPLLSGDDAATGSRGSPPQGQPAYAIPNKLGSYLSAEDIAFMNGGSVLGQANATHRNILPSLNIKWELSDEFLIRFAASRAMSRPDIGNLRNYISISKTTPSLDNPSDPLWVKDANGNVVGANVKYTADAQNPFLKPVTADQVDLSFEYYFAKVGSFTVTLFEKNFHDYIQFGKYYRNLTNNGVTRQVEVRGPLNGEGARLDGFELAFQRFFDFLPTPFDGLGVQANYTYLHNAGITNSNIVNTTANSSTISGQAPDSVKVNRLEGLSDHSANLVLMYEKDDWKARLAYSWRSEYMITAIDCCVAVPIWNKATGQLDGSISYKFSDNIEMAFQASNLLNEQTVLTQQVSNYNDGGTRLPNAWFQNDRRYTLGLRLKY